MKNVFVALCVALLATFVMASSANARVCEEEVFATGNARALKLVARSSAKNAWRKEAKARYGGAIWLWSLASRKAIFCAKGSKDGKKGWICTAEGLPCRLGGHVAVPGHGGGGDMMLPDRTLRPGEQGKDVEILQRVLNKAGYNLVVDGDYGSGTTRAVRDFQTKEGIGVDGSVGPQTRGRLRRFMR